MIGLKTIIPYNPLLITISHLHSIQNEISTGWQPVFICDGQVVSQQATI